MAAPSAIIPSELQSPEDYYAQRVAEWALGGFVRFAGQARSARAREVILRAASGGRFAARELDDWTARDRSLDPQVVQQLASCDSRLVLALAQLMATQRLDDLDTARTIHLYRLIEAAWGARAFSRLDRLHYLELLVDTRAAEDFAQAFWANALTERDWAQAVLLGANLCNPWLDGTANDAESRRGWHRMVNSLYLAAGVEPLEILDGYGAPMDNILCSPADRVEDGPTVTVLVPTHNPSERLGTAMSALVKQSWTNLEILVLDDGSEPGFRYRMDAWADLDPRVRVLRMPSNVGNYAARNIGMDESVGEFVTVHDDDDWSHPRKIEVQVRNLLEHPDRLANMSQLVRATSDLEFTRINSNHAWIQPNYSSLMYRREVTEVVGYWDEVTRAGDAEYRNRLTAATGRPPVVVGGAPLSFLRVRSGSLTHGEIQRAHIHQRRRWYDLASRGWHHDQLRAEAPLRLPKGNRSAPRYSAPVGMVPGDPQRLDVDVVYATDFRFPGGNSSISVNEIEQLLFEGRSVALLQLDSPVLVGTTELHPRVAAVALREGCHVITTSTEVEARVAIVRHPTVLQFAEQVRSGVTAAHHLLIVNHAPSLRDGTEAHYEINACVSAFEVVFGAPPLVAPESGVIRQCLEGRLTSGMTPYNWSGSLPPVDVPPRTERPDRPPVIGRHSRDNREKWPVQPEVIAAAYPTSDRDVRILGGAAIPVQRLGSRPDNWTVHEFGSREPQDFLAEIDFWVYFHDENLIESFGMATVEAMAAGLVVVLPPYMSATFGEGAVYCEAGDVQRLVDWFWEHPADYCQQSARAQQVVADRFGYDAFDRRMEALLS